MVSKFWSDTTLEPKRQFKFLFVIPAPEGTQAVESYLVKQVAKPQFQLGETKVNYIQHTFKYPGRLTWQDISVTLIDTIRTDDTSSRLANILRASGYVIPDTAANAQFSFTKQGSANALNSPYIQQIDGGNPANNIAPRVVEQWNLRNAWVKSVNFGTLNYNSDELVDITLGISYDWAEYFTVGASGGVSEDSANGLMPLPQES